MKKLILIISLMSLFIAIPAHASDKNSACSTTLSSDEQRLYELIMEYRKSLGLPSIPVSPSLSFVAQTHVRDLQAHPPSGNCNMHSWSTYGSWSACCYTPDHAQANYMWNKPSELSDYKGNGFEIAYGGSLNATPAGALRGWQSSSGHNAVITNTNVWKSHPWKAIGIGIYGSYAVVWFGEEDDPCLSAAAKKSLFDAVASGEIKQVEAAIAAGADVNAKDEDGYTALHKAATGSYVNAADDDNIKYGEIVKLLIDKGADVNAKTNTGWTPLHSAMFLHAYTNIIDLLLSKGANINAKDDNGNTPLIAGLGHHNNEGISFLLSKGADVNAKDEYGSTALYYAARQGDKELVELLLANGADVNMVNNEGDTPLYYTVKGDDTGEIDNIDVVRLLIEKGADVNAKNGSVLWTAARYGELEVVKLLLSHKADPNVSLALHAAALSGNLEIIQVLLANGADPTLKDYKGQTPLDIIKGPEMSVYEDQAKIIKLLQTAMKKNKK